ncbi:hypothetical protein Patl1_27261 [Pistacia atlantica]|uniref:Uncharacterized protein n=1 Tax=Pistacia atlantica TaxID=434234 RepID=A0ACC1BC12_9ROSI|nr:hypothetical protein Patl1_27261 [Pistacia atlantica]
MTICCFIYSFLYCTYLRDYERARMHALIEPEMQQLEADHSPSMEKHCQLDVSESKTTDGRKGSKTDIDHGRNETNDLDDNDEKYLLSHT